MISSEKLKLNKKLAHWIKLDIIKKISRGKGNEIRNKLPNTTVLDRIKSYKQ